MSSNRCRARAVGRLCNRRRGRRRSRGGRAAAAGAGARRRRLRGDARRRGLGLEAQRRDSSATTSAVSSARRDPVGESATQEERAGPEPRAARAARIDSWSSTSRARGSDASSRAAGRRRAGPRPAPAAAAPNNAAAITCEERVGARALRRLLPESMLTRAGGASVIRLGPVARRARDGAAVPRAARWAASACQRRLGRARRRSRPRPTPRVD